MKRREFIVNSLLAIGGTALLNGCGAGGANAKRKKTGLVVTRKFKNLDIPLLSFGCMRLPKLEDGTIDMPQFEKMTEYAMKHGVNYFDTAYGYHAGESENAVGKVLSNYKRDSFFLATKNPLRALTSKEDVRRIFEEQLKKCQTDYFDFYLAHNISVLTIDNFRSFGVYEELAKLKEEGKIRHLGFSYHGSYELLEEVAKEYPWEFCQIQLNYLDWTAMNVKQSYEVLTQAGIPVLPMSPLRGGALTKLTGSAKAVLEDEAPNDTQASFALRWVAGRENNFTVLSGMSSLQQMEENVETFINYKPITKKEEDVADKISSILQKQGEINCTTCNYCQDCPRGVAIPAIFDMYNEYKAAGKTDVFLQKYDALKDREKAGKCIKCGLCSENCPQLLDIPPLLEMIDNTVKNLKKGA
ncbi:MAG: aldo/keto reductase [Endomicrobium sp.]|jgi:predicted aldo/keto reductase-like oxidoreductase|nr:aldo/keto reductase [Endomicrobium sp.]